MQQNPFRPFVPVVILFILLNVFFIAGKNLLSKWGADQSVLFWGNLVLLNVTFLSFWLGQRGLRSANAQAFVRSVYASFIVKFFILIAAAFIYIMMAKKNVNKPALFSCMGLYLVYTFLEVSILMKLLKQKKNA